MVVRILFSVALLVLTAALPGAAAQSGNPFADRHVEATLAPELAVAAPGKPVWVALAFEIDPGWHTYWKNPGDSGEPTRLTWTLPQGVFASDIHWPYPHRIPYGPLVNFGYDGEVTHLVRIDVPAAWPAGKPLDLKAKATWLVCADVCIPEDQTFSLSLPTAEGAWADPAVAPLFAAARAALPVDNPWPSRFAADGDRLQLAVDVGPAAERVREAVFFPAAWGHVEPAGEQTLEVSGGTLRLALVPGELTPEATLDGVLVLTEEAADGAIVRALSVAAPAGPSPAVAPATGGSMVAGGGAPGSGGGTAVPLGIGEALVLALLGGLILNLMPCVFPVLSIKALALVRHAGNPGRPAWTGGIAYTAGVVAFMAGLAVLLIGLRATGAEIGWGFQLQSPVFVALMALVLFCLGLALSGVLQIGGSIAGLGDSLAGRRGLVGDAATGALAALVATPCTAPFMGAAIGFALTQPWFAALAVMVTLGLGLALPYLLLSLAPGLGRWLPKPGVWMDRLKQILAFPLYASAAWLVWVLAIQSGPSAVFAVLIAMVLIGFAVWLHGATGGSAASVWRWTGRFGTVAAVAGAVGLSVVAVEGPVGAGAAIQATNRSTGPVEPFAPERLAALRAEGRPVFVNMTAAWCITCKVNEQVALKAERVADAFAAGGIVWLEGDWTNRDPVITRYLESFGRSGVPLYVLYPAGGGEPVVLPQILTEEGMVTALASATAPAATAVPDGQQAAAR